MKFLPTTLIAASVAAALLITGFATQGQAQDAAAAYKMREDAMRAQIGAYQRITKADDAKATVEDTKAIQASLKTLENAAMWPEGSITAESRSKPEIWQNMADFKAKLAATEKEAATLVATAEKGDIEAVKAQSKVMFDSCNVCHAAYRGPAKTK